MKVRIKENSLVMKKFHELMDFLEREGIAITSNDALFVAFTDAPGKWRLEDIENEDDLSSIPPDVDFKLTQEREDVSD